MAGGDSSGATMSGLAPDRSEAGSPECQDPVKRNLRNPRNLRISVPRNLRIFVPRNP
jgi:hypothetical protein